MVAGNGKIQLPAGKVVVIDRMTVAGVILCQCCHQRRWRDIEDVTAARDITAEMSLWCCHCGGVIVAASLWWWWRRYSWRQNFDNSWLASLFVFLITKSCQKFL
ncbi:unnamed protein product [Cuscuta europaea]|uniref:Uncharacterized protein n=1 Tax=Cuscuta europaea TaxID=41803 RepID=A0A9P0ZAE5_CUSEU|nr:unnamed protein product [Cuscuta europaea]